ncbi:MAG TPA: Stp1/IreP family PP2C-type Ser/Thr phosphatase [Actinomycetota bacterium]|nr:Stp1/IreP family PP2C-type Ser/Thr phosphatase [Actinomycetota bacterium]
MNLSIGAKSDVGQVREGNEDSYLVDEPLFVVADGMGGHLAGDVASSTAVEVISSHSDSASAEDPQTLAQLVRDANSAIWEKAKDDPALRGMGTTCTLVLFDGSKAFFAHVGDSRAYLLRDGQLEQITEDHTLVARMVQEGRIRPEEAEHHPQRSIITRALGVDADVEVDLISVDLQPGDRLMMCSDGLSSMIDSNTIATALKEQPDPQSAAEELVRLANEAGGEDNITVVVIDVDEEGSTRRSTAPPPPPPPTPARDPSGPLEPEEASPSRRWPKTLLISLIVLALLGGGAYFLIQYMRTSSWYVGLNEDDLVTIYQGRPEDLFGIDLDEEVEVTDLKLVDLPENLRDNVEQGREADSREGAEEIVTDLEKRVKDVQDAQPKDEPSPESHNSPGSNGSNGNKGN